MKGRFYINKVSIMYQLVVVIIFLVASLANMGCSNVDREIRRLNDKTPSVRIEAAKKLGELKDTRAVEPLIGTLKDKDPNVRGETLYALGKIDDPRAVELTTVKLVVDEDYGAAKDVNVICEPASQ